MAITNIVFFSILSLCIFAPPANAQQILRGNGVQTQSNIAMPSSVYEKTINQFGRRQYPTQEDAGSWDELSDPAEARGGDVGFSVTGENMEADLPIDERLASEESWMGLLVAVLVLVTKQSPRVTLNRDIIIL